MQRTHSLVAVVFVLLISALMPGIARAELPATDFMSVVKQYHASQTPSSLTATAAKSCPPPNTDQPTPPWQPPGANSLSGVIYKVGYRLNGNHSFTGGPNLRVYARREYSTCVPTQIETDCRGRWEELKSAAQAIGALPNIADLQQYAVMRFGRYRYEWISCDHSEPVPPDNPFTITVGPDLQYVGWHNQPADAGVDLPRNKTYYRLGLRNKVAAIREGRFWMVWFWKNYKKAHKECRGKSFKIPHDLTWVDATQERITLGSRSGVQVSMSSNFGSKPFERTSRRTGKTVPC